MKLSITDRSDLLDGVLKNLIERRLLFSLSRFDSKIKRVELTLSDENGPRGGHDKSCRLAIRLKNAADVFIRDVDAEVAVCVSRVADRAGRAVARSVDRTQSIDRTRVSALSSIA